MRQHFDLARGQLRVRRAGGPFPHGAFDRDDKLAAQRLRQFPRRLVVLRVEHHLRDAFAVAQVNEDDAAVVAPHVHPAGQTHLLPDVRRAQFPAMMCPFHRINPFRSCILRSCREHL